MFGHSPPLHTPFQPYCPFCYFLNILGMPLLFHYFIYLEYYFHRYLYGPLPHCIQVSVQISFTGRQSLITLRNSPSALSFLIPCSWFSLPHSTYHHLTQYTFLNCPPSSIRVWGQGFLSVLFITLSAWHITGFDKYLLFEGRMN